MDFCQELKLVKQKELNPKATFRKLDDNKSSFVNAVMQHAKS